jgi:pseudouridine-5'-phosphate glycosidase
MIPPWLKVSDEVAAGIIAGRPVVALESTLIAHGLPWPTNLETARESEEAVRTAGAIPATIAVWHGTPTIGLTPEQTEMLARTPGVVKASRRDLGAAVGLKQLAATTVSATMTLAHAAGVRVFATGGIGGAHRGERGAWNAERGVGPCGDSHASRSVIETALWDISADLTELARTPVLVVCAGAKSILDLPRTLEILETLGVPVLGYQTNVFPTFYVRDVMTGDLARVGRERPELPVSARVESSVDAAAIFDAHVRMGGGGAVLAQPCPADIAIPPDQFEDALGRAQEEADAAGISGPKVTPFLLARLAELTVGRTLIANRALIVQNARLAGEVALALTGQSHRG